MKAYLATSGLLFVAMMIAHVARIFVEGPGLAAEPVFAMTSALSIGMSAWALWLIRTYPARGGANDA